MNDIKRGVHVIYNPDTDKWEVWKLTPAEAFDLTQERFGVGVALENLNFDERNEDHEVHSNRTD